MQYVGKLVSSVYNTITPNINPSTLNGAIDVIVVEREVDVDEKVTHADGTESVERRRTTELAASPFHVRFGKMSVLRPDERKVTLHLNGSSDPLPFAMKVGENGEAFFVMKIDDAGEGVPAALVTSPIVGPTSEPVDPKPHDLEPLDLGMSQAALDSPSPPSPAKDESETHGGNDVDSEEYPAPFGAGTEDVPAHELESAPPGGDTPLHASKQVVMDLLDMDGYKVTQNKQQQAMDQGKRFAAEMPLSRRHGGNGSLGYGERLDRQQPVWKRQLISQVVHPTHESMLSAEAPTRHGHSRRASDTSVHMADIAAAASVSERPHLPVSLSDSALLRSSRYMYEAPRETSGVQDDALLPGAEASGDAQLDDVEAVGTLACSDTDPYLFQLQMDSSTVYAFELSLCNFASFEDADDAEKSYLFDEARVSFQRFLEDDSMMDDARLCIRHNESYHTWASDAEMFSTLRMYGHMLRNGEQSAADAKETLRAPGKRSVWDRLWSSKAEVDDDAPPAPLAKSATAMELSDPMRSASATPPPSDPVPETYVKTLRLTSDQLKELGLRKGANTITFSVTSSYSGVATCRARVFLWDSLHPVVVSDIDGTITKSDALGHVFTLMGRDWTHLGIAKLYHDIAKNGYRFMYLTSRAIGQAEITRDYLTNINQNNFRLPDGPVIMSPDRLMASLHREVILKKPEVFKMACLRDIARLFGEDPRNAPSGETGTPFYAGFGNRITDALSYRSVNIPSSRIFTIDSNGEVKMELLELAGYKSSYPNMTDLVDQMFPPTVVHKPRDAKAAAYTDFNYWRQEAVDIELPPDDELVPAVVQPTSPALRALRSPRSSSRQSSASLLSPPTPAADQETKERPSRFSRFGLSKLVSRKKDKGGAASPPPASPEFGPRSLDAHDHAMLPASVLSSSLGSARAPYEARQQLLFEDPESLDDEQDEDEDEDDDGRLSPAARRRRRRRGESRATSPSPLFPSLYASEDSRRDRTRAQSEPPEEYSQPPRSPPPRTERTERTAPSSPDTDEDPLLASGDIQFEWRG